MLISDYFYVAEYVGVMLMTLNRLTAVMLPIWHRNVRLLNEISSIFSSGPDVTSAFLPSSACSYPGCLHVAARLT